MKPTRISTLLGPVLFPVVVVLVVAFVSGAATEAPPVGSGLLGIRASEIEAHVSFLASDDLGGRAVGEDGVRRAEEYIAKVFESSGLETLSGDEDYFAEFSLYGRGFDTAATGLDLHRGEWRRAARLGSDFRPFGFSAEGTVDADVVFAGYGVSAPEHDWDDYAGLDVEGKVVLVLRYEPGQEDPASRFDGTRNTEHALFMTKADNAERHGALGMLLVTGPLSGQGGEDLRIKTGLALSPGGADRVRGSSGRRSGTLVSALISQDLAQQLAGGDAGELERLQRAIENGIRPADLKVTGTRARLRVERRPDLVEVQARNVVGFVEGSDPELKHEWIVIGGHHDHLGQFGSKGDHVFNGADDNASGTAGVLELAQAFGTRERRPRRSLVFATFSAEERGLLGSRALVSQGPLPLEQVGFMLNLDMIGRNPGLPVQVYGDGFGSGLRHLVEEVNEDIGLPLSFAGSRTTGNSDHEPFFSHDVPYLFLFTGLHGDYHQVSDDADRLDYEHMEELLRLSYGVVDRLADAESLPSFVHHVSWLGAKMTTNPDDGETVLVAVERDSVAASAGLRAGDRILGFGDVGTADAPRDAGRRLRSVDAGDGLRVRVGRGDERLSVDVQRAQIGYLGIQPAPIPLQMGGLQDSGRGGILVVQVEPEGPSDRAGMRAGDIVVNIAGESVSPANLAAVLGRLGAGRVVTVQVLREGTLVALSVELGVRPDGP